MDPLRLDLVCQVAGGLGPLPTSNSIFAASSRLLGDVREVRLDLQA